MLLKGKNAVITGCARGIGRSMLDVFAENGANIWACCRSRTDEFERAISDLMKIHGVWIEPLYFDLRNTEDMKQALKTIMARKLPIDVLVNNAGIIGNTNTLFAMTSLEKIRDIFEVNFFSPMLLTQYVLKNMMRHKRGSIINVSSITAMEGNPGQGAYSASKAALQGITATLAVELGEHGVRVNALAPGYIETDMTTSGMIVDRFKASYSQSSMKRPGQTSEIARVALFLASDLSCYMTGQVMRVDGGLHT